MRLNRKKFDNAYDRCWVSVPKGDRTYKNGMDHPEIKESILDLYRYRCNGKCTSKFRRWFEAVVGRHSDPLKAAIYEELSYHYWGRAEYEWWDGDKKVNWFDPNDKDTWQQVLDGCRPLFELFEEIECSDS